MDIQKETPAGIAASAASLVTLHCQALQARDAGECKRLFRACETSGFFYLDVGGIQEGITEAINHVYALEAELFSLPEDDLMKFDIDKQFPGKLNGFVQNYHYQRGHSKKEAIAEKFCRQVQTPWT